MKTKDNLLIKLARSLSEHCHHDKKYGDKDYFDFHIIGVVNECVNGFDQYPDVKKIDYTKMICVALLHDVIEDCGITKRALWELFGSEIAIAVELLSKKPHETRTEYLFGVAKNPLAKYVKICDATFNMQACVADCNYKRSKYYEDTISFLKEC